MMLKLKVIAAILLIMSMLFPLSRHTRGDLSLKDVNPPEYTYDYALSHFEFSSLNSWAKLLAYLWPLGAIPYRRLSRHKQKWTGVVELVLCLWSGFNITMEAMYLGEIWIGAYIALVALSSYSILTIRSFGASLTSRSS